MLSIFILIPFFVLIGVIIWLVVYYSMLSYAREEQKKLNETIKDSLKNKDFKQSKVIYLDDNATSGKEDNLVKKFISIDNENKKILLIDYKNKNFYIVKFSEILSYEIYENGKTVTDGAKVGGFLGLFTASTAEKSTDLRLIIKLDSLEVPQVSYEIIEYGNLGGVNKTSEDYRRCISKLQEASAILDVILKENKKQ